MESFNLETPGGEAAGQEALTSMRSTLVVEKLFLIGQASLALSPATVLPMGSSFFEMRNVVIQVLNGPQ